MEELIKKLKEAGREDAFASEEAFRAAAQELGYTQEQLDEMFHALGGLPLEDDAMDVTGGFSLAAMREAMRQSDEKMEKLKKMAKQFEDSYGERFRSIHERALGGQDR